MTKEQEIVSLQHKISNLESELDKAELKITASKSAKEGEEEHKSVNEALNRKIALLESELDNAEKQLRETTDKWVVPFHPSHSPQQSLVISARGVGNWLSKS